MNPISSNPFNFIQMGSDVPPTAGLREDPTPLQMTPDEFRTRLSSGELPNQPIRVKGDLNLYICTSLTSLPEGLHVDGDLNLFGCMSLTSLPEGLHVDGDLNLFGCTSLTSLPEGSRMGGSLDLGGCTSLTSLPEGFRVGGDLRLSGCTSLTSLPEGLHVDGELYLYGCTSLTSLPEGLHVDGYLMSLTSLPSGLHVDGDLNLGGCTSLTSLPEGLDVDGDLNLEGCMSLTSLPEGLHVDGDLNLGGCTSLTSLPNDITNWGLRVDGNTREVDLSGTGLSDALIDRLRATEAPGMRFLFSRQAEPVADQFATLTETVNFWRSLLVEEEAVISLNLKFDQQADLIRFLTRLKATVEYQNLAARPTLAKRIYDVLKEMQRSNEFKETACLIIHQGLSTCHDRIISALDELDLMLQIKKAEEQGGREELRKLGKGMLMLEEVRRAAQAHARTLTWVEEIEIQLALQIGLRDRLKLPLSTGHMIFRGCAQVSDEKIQEFGAAIEHRIRDTSVEAYLQTWSPWQMLLRREVFDALKLEDGKAPEDLEWVCCVGTEELTEGYLYGERLYAQGALRKIYIEKGVDPFTTLPIDLINIKKVVKVGTECNL